MNAFRMRYVLVALLLGFALGAEAAKTSTESVDAIRATLAEQDAAWNRGDVDGFMQGYWQDESLRFASGDRVTYGWLATLKGYRARYPDKATMGTLTTSDLDIELLGDNAALVFGRWSLAREKDNPHGLFTLLLRRTPTGWKITRDHTSSAE